MWLWVWMGLAVCGCVQNDRVIIPTVGGIVEWMKCVIVHIPGCNLSTSLSHSRFSIDVFAVVVVRPLPPPPPPLSLSLSLDTYNRGGLVCGHADFVISLVCLLLRWLNLLSKYPVWQCTWCIYQCDSLQCVHQPVHVYDPHNKVHYI